MAPIRLGIIGLSADRSAWASHAHVGPLRSTPLLENYKITAVATSSAESAKAAAEAYQIPADHAYHSAEAIANDSEVDMGVVSVKAPLHKELAIPILKAKKDIFVEWPLGNSLQEAEELAALAKEQGVRTVVGLASRNMPVLLKAKELIDAGVLGRVTTTNLFTSSGMFGTFPEKHRFLNDKDIGAHILSIPTAHLLDPLCFLLGEFESLNATAATTYPTVQFVKVDGTILAPEPRNFRDTVMVHGVLKNGITVGFMYTSTSKATPDSIEWIISGETGALKFSGPSAFMTLGSPKLYLHKPSERGGEERSKTQGPSGGRNWAEVEIEAPVPAVGGIGPIYEAFASSKQGNYVDFDGAVIRHKMVEAVSRSVEKGTREVY